SRSQETTASNSRRLLSLRCSTTSGSGRTKRSTTSLHQSRAREYLAARGKADWIPEIEAMIADHHKVTTSRANSQWLVESFRRADWIDVTRGLRRFGLPRPFIAVVAATWPDAGFHRRLVELTIDRWWKHP